MEKHVGVCMFSFNLNLKSWNGKQFRRNINIHGELAILKFRFPKIG